jgi:hypothetical protein
MTDSKCTGKRSAPVTVKVTERQRKLYNEVHQYSGQSQHIIKAIDGVCKTSERKKKKHAYKILLLKPEAIIWETNRAWEDNIKRKETCTSELDEAISRQGPLTHLLHRNEHSGSSEEEFVDQLSYHQILKDPALWSWLQFSHAFNSDGWLYFLQSTNAFRAPSKAKGETRVFYIKPDKCFTFHAENKLLWQQRENRVRAC